MRKLLSSLMLFAAAAMAFSSCTNNEISADKSEAAGEVTVFHITASAPGTRTVFGAKAGNNYPTLWTNTKKVAFSYDEATFSDETPNVDAGKTTASFDVKFTGAPASGTIYAFSPKGDFNSTPKVPGFTGFTTYSDSKAIYLNIPTEQTPLENSVDESAQAIVAEASYSNSDANVNMVFHHIVAYGKMAITNFAGTIKSVELQFPENVAGASCRYLYKESTPSLASVTANSITLNPANVSGGVFWFALAPTAGTTGEMKVIITDTNDDTYTKTLDLATKALPFIAGKVSSFSVNFSGVVKDPANLKWDLSTDNTTTATASEMTWSGTSVSMGVVKGSASTNTNNYYPGTPDKSYTSTRFYAGSILSISPASGYAIESIEFTATSDSYATALKNSTWTNGTATADNSIVTILPTDGASAVSATLGATCGFTQVKVTYSPACVTPVISYNRPTVTITSETADASIYYTLDGTDPTSSSTQYNAPFDIDENCTVKAIAIKTGYHSSGIASQYCLYNTSTYTITISGSISNGTVSADPAQAVEGTEVTLTATPNSGYTFKSWDVKKTASSEAITVTNNKFTMPAEAVTVSAEFEAATETTVTYSVTSKTAASVSSGTAPSGSSVTYTQTYSTAKQATSGNSLTLTLKGFEGKTITAIKLSMHSNSKQGAGTLSVSAGTTSIAGISSATNFNKWYNNTSFGNTFRDITVTLTNDTYVIKKDEDIVFHIACTTNSLYCESYTITYK